ncbi:MAG: AAA-like domain-containing protein [Eubacteriales bacterium]|nr:AAA-like domain-containing protein [Eubacteriales bacterium]
MRRRFNTEGSCNPEEHYMVNIDNRVQEAKELVERMKYFTINRGRQYGKTTTLDFLSKKLQDEYCVFYISFEGLAEESYQNERAFCRTFAGLLFDAIDYGETQGIADSARDALEEMSLSDEESVVEFRALSNLISKICRTAEKPVVLLIDEVDQAGNYQTFLTFLGMLRTKYLKRKQRPTFQSVILAGVYDIKNLKRKIRPEGEHVYNSPWNIAVSFLMDMSFSVDDIKGMLGEYEADYQTGMDIQGMVELIFDYTSGYPFLVSDICKILDEQIVGQEGFPDRSAAWTREGFLEALKRLLLEKNTLMESLVNKLTDYPELREMIYSILFGGERITFNPDNRALDIAGMFGFVRNERGSVVIANRIFETRLYNLFLSEEELESMTFKAASIDKNQFIQNGTLNMELVLKKFVVHWNDLYHSSDEKFIEDNGRKFFLLYLKPIINGVGNFYVEARTRDNGRTDVIVDYRGKQYIVEIKIWRGSEYNERGEEQLAAYLEAYHARKGYLLSFNFNKKKTVGTKEILCGDKTIFEAVL